MFGSTPVVQRVITNTETKTSHTYSCGVLLFVKGEIPKVVLVRKKYTPALRVILLGQLTSVDYNIYLAELTEREVEFIGSMTEEQYNTVFDYLPEIAKAYPRELFFKQRETIYQMAKLLEPSSGRIKEFWELPKGRQNSYESPVMAALREIREECGIEVSQENLIKNDSGEFLELKLEKQTPDLRHFTGTFYVTILDSYDGPKSKIDESEISGSRAIPISEIGKFLHEKTLTFVNNIYAMLTDWF